MKPLSSFEMWTPCSISEPFEGHDKVVLKTHTQNTQNKEKLLVFLFATQSVKLGGWSLLPSLSLFEGRGLSYYPQRTFIDLFFFSVFTMHLYHPDGFSEDDSESTLFKLGIPPVLHGVGTQIFLFLTCLSVSVNSD